MRLLPSLAAVLVAGSGCSLSAWFPEVPAPTQRPRVAQAAPSVSAQPAVDLTSATPQHVAFTGAWYAPSGDRIAVADDQWRVEVWDLVAHAKIASFRAPGYVGEVVWWPSGGRLAALTSNGAVVFGVAKGEIEQRIFGSAATASSPGRAMRFTSDRRTLAVVHEEGRVDLVDVATGAVRGAIATGLWPCAIDAWADGDATLVVGQPGLRAVAFDVATGAKKSEVTFHGDRSYDKTLIDVPSARGAIVALHRPNRARLDFIGVATGIHRATIEHVIMTPIWNEAGDRLVVLTENGTGTEEFASVYEDDPTRLVWRVKVDMYSELAAFAGGKIAVRSGIGAKQSLFVLDATNGRSLGRTTTRLASPQSTRSFRAPETQLSLGPDGGSLIEVDPAFWEVRSAATGATLLLRRVDSDVYTRVSGG